jgi:hypothetical protein
MNKPKAFKIVLSNKSSIQIDEEELQKVIKGITSGQPVIVRQGIFNPSFFISITEDNERIKEYFDEINEVNKANENYNKYEIGEKKEMPEFKKLDNIFGDIKLLKEIYDIKNRTTLQEMWNTFDY